LLYSNFFSSINFLHRGDIPLKATEHFMTKLSELEEIGKASPVIQDDQVSYIYIQYSNLYLLALARNNVNAIAILAFLHKLVEIFKHYFREVSSIIG
jgi:AP-1 complex subunit mu